MAHRRPKSIGTQEMHLRRVSFRRVAQLGEKVKAEYLIGWEYTPPEKGQPYEFQLQDGPIFRSSLIQEIERTQSGLIIRTANSIYEVRYLHEHG